MRASAPAALSVHSDSSAVEVQCKTLVQWRAVQDSGAVELGSASAHDPEINVFNLDEGGDQRGPHSLAGQLSIDQELHIHSLDSDTEL